MNVLVTGSNGFVGSALIEHVAGIRKYQVIAAYRSLSMGSTGNAATLAIGDLGSLADITTSLRAVDVVVHTAGLAHVFNTSRNFLDELHNINVNGTVNLARQAAVAGVRRFIFISSVKVNGNETQPGRPYSELSPIAPVDPYGRSKFEAEERLRQLADETGMEIVIIRPPLVYGLGVKGNFRRLLHLVDLGIPLPLGGVRNQRSLIALDNLVDFIITCISHPAAANQTFLVSDGEDLSTPELLQCLGKAMNKPVRLISLPVNVIEFSALLVRRKKEVKMLCGNLQVNIARAREMLGWTPPVTIAEGLRRTVA
ncbi:NAD-dependent epimerase/dehydratase family protein [Desulfopila inferna]|uniref:NAD-dependent epimerase/dehydratase family protein n=1 Tax=Desulfopila inferna TaxID=468528 RepID=UPI0019652C81|nr:NAD-dependent epimerase/dehydratase family protein [Desulfopila inferna]MBM9602693.1 NAD-dependent epimerase/dehydratase family protein [Desulfopila inferna]